MRSPKRRLVLLAVICLAALSATWAWFRMHPFVRCEQHASAAATGNLSYQVLVVNKLCDGIASSDDVSIVLVDREHNRTEVLAYGAAYSFVRNSNDATPVIEWKGVDTLSISIEKVAYISTQLDHVGAVRIETHIGSVSIK